MWPPQPGGYFQGGMHPPLAALQPLRRGCHGNERGRLPFASRDARRQHSSAWPWPCCRTATEILIRANCQQATPILRAERGSCRHSVVPSPGLALRSTVPSLAVWGALVSPNLARIRASHPCGGRASPGWSPAAPKCRQTSHRTAREPIYFPHLKKVIKRKGRSYLFFCYASPELSNSQIKSWKHLMKGRDWRQGLVGSSVGLRWGWADAGETHPRAGGWEPAAPQLSLAGGLAAAAAQKGARVLSGGRFGKRRAGAANGLPGAQPSGSSVCVADTHARRRGCPSDGAGGAPRALHPAGTGAARQGRGGSSAPAWCVTRAGAQYSQGKNFF